MEAHERIEKMLIYLNINAKVFSERLGYERPQAIYDIQNGKTKTISARLAMKIVSVFPVFSKAWLLTGEGEMLNADVKQPVEPLKGNTIAIPIEALETIQKQADSLASLTKSVADLTELLKKSGARVAGDAGAVAAG